MNDREHTEFIDRLKAYKEKQLKKKVNKKWMKNKKL